MKAFYRAEVVIIVLLCLISCHSVTQPKLKPLSSNDIIMAFGDSLTFGTGARAENSYPQILETITGLKVINAGIEGEETADGLKRIGDELDKNNPQLVIVCLGGNDMLRHRPAEKIKANLKQIIQVIQQKGAQVLLIAVPRPGLHLSVPDFYQELGTELHVPVDNTSLVELLGDPKYKSDYIHLNDQGYALWARDIARLLRELNALNPAKLAA